ncbi:Predicted histone tail methylase containing SET domain [Phaffia rhodozyma]|uniref:Predicted histone tail methylase containing SET domain n=1 Tax=Phaffia rhodozyma TaxID=264483 RepID=A0A0F7SE85_PHARH|nr:Predicted histone tail methylase containing SET domain [Phaffia rhodozyma]
MSKAFEYHQTSTEMVDFLRNLEDTRRAVAQEQTAVPEDPPPSDTFQSASSQNPLFTLYSPFQLFTPVDQLVETAEYIREKRIAMGKLVQTGHRDMKQTYAGKKHSSLCDIRKLNRIGLGDMSCRKVHVGSYLLCRIVSRPSRIVGVTFVIQDPAGLAETLAFYNAPIGMTPTGPDLDILFPLGSILAVREPYYKLSSAGAASIRVDSPTGLIWVDEGNALVRGVSWKKAPFWPEEIWREKPKKTAEQLKTTGNQLLSAGRLLAAEHTYSQGLALDPNHLALRLNRAAVRIRLKQFRSALVDTDHVLTYHSTSIPEPLLEKALFRSATAQYALGQYSLANATYGSLLSQFPQSQEARNGIAAIATRLVEMKSGYYDWIELYKSSQTNPAVDVAEYAGPVKVGLSPGRGRGLFLTEDVKAGQLLILSKPFAAVYKTDLGPDQSLFSCNLHTNTIDIATQSYLTQPVLAHIKDDPSAYKAFSCLYAGPEFPLPPVFSALEVVQPRTQPSMQPVDIDISHVEAAISFNSFSPRRISPALEWNPDYGSLSPLSDTSPTGLYILPSVINHECLGNCSLTFWGNAMCIRPRAGLKKGQELTISYASRIDLDKRTAILKKHRIRCTCRLCQEDLRDSAMMQERRLGLVARMENLTKNEPNVKSLKLARGMMQELIETYSKDSNPFLRIDLWIPFHILADQLSYFARSLMYSPSMNQPSGGRHPANSPDYYANESIHFEKMALESCGVVLSPTPPVIRSTPLAREDPCVDSALHIAALYNFMNMRLEARWWVDGAVLMHSVNVGGGRKLFKLRFKSKIEACDVGSYLD